MAIPLMIIAAAVNANHQFHAAVQDAPSPCKLSGVSLTKCPVTRSTRLGDYVNLRDTGLLTTSMANLCTTAILLDWIIGYYNK